MSDTVSNSVDRYGRASTKMSSNNPDQPKKAAGKRILACVLCQQRKKKCDRKSPCSNCIKVKAPQQSMAISRRLTIKAQSSLHPQHARSSKEAQTSKSRSPGEACKMRGLAQTLHLYPTPNAREQPPRAVRAVSC